MIIPDLSYDDILHKGKILRVKQEINTKHLPHSNQKLSCNLFT